jgi:hypothetical protein
LLEFHKGNFLSASVEYQSHSYSPVMYISGLSCEPVTRIATGFQGAMNFFTSLACFNSLIISRRV